MQCTATAKSTGERCRRHAVNGYKVCQVHGAGSPKQGRRGGRPPTHGRYSKWKKEDIRELVEQFEADEEPLNILPEIAAVRALLTDFIDTYNQRVDALIAWNADEAAEARANKRKPRPQRLPELDDAIQYLQTVARIAQKEKRLQSDTAISRKDLARILQEMGRIVDQHTDTDTQQAIREGWSTIHLA